MKSLRKYVRKLNWLATNTRLYPVVYSLDLAKKSEEGCPERFMDCEQNPPEEFFSASLGWDN